MQIGPECGGAQRWDDEQRDRTGAAPAHPATAPEVKVFCIGVGNDVNKPLLEQIADDSGGIAALPLAG
jgi:hypothetical protein